LPSSEIKKLWDDNTTSAKQVVECTGEDIGFIGPNDLPCPDFRVNGSGHDWPKGYKVITIDGESGNHGFGYGIGINMETNEVVYWAEYW